MLPITHCAQILLITVATAPTTQTVGRYKTQTHQQADGIWQNRPSQGVLHRFGAFCTLFASQCCSHGQQFVADPDVRETLANQLKELDWRRPMQIKREKQAHG